MFLRFTVVSFIAFCVVLGAFAQNKNAYRLVWGDEFNVDGLPDSTAWGYEKGFVRNEELQWYRPENAYCQNGYLVLEARKDTILNPAYNKDNKAWQKARQYATISSASVLSKGKKEFRYGRFEVRARIPIESGSWPAIWTLGNHMEWPSCGEIDMMEYYRIDGVPHILANVAWGTDTPFDARWDSAKIPFSRFTEKDKDWASKFHVWRMDWDKEAIRLYLDNELLNETLLSETINGSIGNNQSPFHQPHYVILNLAIGGQHGGEPNLPYFPLRYEIDYVRVYQK